MEEWEAGEYAHLLPLFRGKINVRLQWVGYYDEMEVLD
jgi:hypothetical protein